MALSLTYRRLRAPRHDGGILFEPSWRDCLLLPANNRQLIDACNFELCGRTFQSLRTIARAELLALAMKHTRQYCDVQMPLTVDGPIVMSGHQPQLIHPGVWAKNFALHRIAEELHGVAVQVIMDNDLMRDHSLPVPVGSIASPRVVTEPFDHFQRPQPFETRHVADDSLFASFAQRVSSRIRPSLGRDPLITKIWPDVVSATRSGQPIGLAFARARHRLELDWGLSTIEVPLSQLCDTSSFRCLVLDLLLRGDELRSSYNRGLAEYRDVHRLRSAAQPLPDLGRSGDWTEAPFWFWTTENPLRQALWWRREGTSLVIGSPNGPSWSLAEMTGYPDQAVEQLAAFAADGLKLRPRALTNTLFARLFLSDMFIHGIGGAKYDQVTDLIIRDMYRTAPPAFLTLSFTCLLPVDFERVNKEKTSENRQLLRQMYFHPEVFLEPEDRAIDQVSNCIEKKARWTTHDLPQELRKERHNQIEAANAMLRDFLRKKTEKQAKVLAQYQDREQASRIWSSREWSFVLFPETFLGNRLLDLGFDNL